MKLQNLLHYPLLAVIITLPFAGARFFVLGVPIYMPELMVIIASTLFVWIQCRTDTLRIQKLPILIVVSIMLLCVGLLSSAIFNGLTLVQLGIIKSWFFFPMLFAWLVFQISHQPKNSVVAKIDDSFFIVRKTLFVWYATLALASLIALVYFFQGDLTYDGRLRAFYLSPNYLALFLFPGVFLGWYFIMQTLDSRLRGNDTMYQLILSGVVFSWIMLCAALYLTLSYTVIISSILGFFTVLFLTSKRSYFLRTALIIFCISIVSLFLLLQTHNQKLDDIIHLNERSSLASRLMIWQASTKMIGNHTFFGIGPGNFQTTYLAYQQYFPPYLEWAVPHPHNLYFSFWLQTGIIGLVGFIMLIIVWARNIPGASITDTKKAPVKWTLLGILITLLYVGLLDTPYFKTDLAYSFWLLIALGL
jgi:O-antigen ligase